MLEIVVRIKGQVDRRIVSYEEARAALDEFLTGHLAPGVRETRHFMAYAINVDVEDDSYQLYWHALSADRQLELLNMVRSFALMT